MIGLLRFVLTILTSTDATSFMHKMLKHIFSTSVLFLVIGLIVPVGNAQEPSTTNSVTVVCLGDSITHAGYPAELEKILPVRAINAGIGGNTSRQGLARLEKDVLAHKPDAVVLFFGTNDTRKDAPKVQVPIPEYEKNLTEIIDRCQSVGAKVILGTIPPIDPTPYFTRHVKEKFDDAGGLEKLVADYRAAALRVGESKKVPVVDLNQLLAKDTTWRSPDGVHPTTEGNTVIAKLFSKQLETTLNLKLRSQPDNPVAP